MPEGRRVLAMQPPAEVPKREDIPKLTRKQLAEYIYDLYHVETHIVDPVHGVGKEEWVRRMLNGVGSAKPAKKEELVRQLGSILDEREGDIRYLDAFVAENGVQLLKARIELTERFSWSDLETELDARDDTAVPVERNPALEGKTTAEIAAIAEHYRAYRRPYASQLVADWEASPSVGEIDYRAAVEEIIEAEFINSSHSQTDEPSIHEDIRNFFLRQKEEGLEYLDEKQYRALYQVHVEHRSILDELAEEYYKWFAGEVLDDEGITDLIEQYNYTFHQDILIAQNEPYSEEELKDFIEEGIGQIVWLDGRKVLTEGEVDDVVDDLKVWFEGSRFDTSATGDFDGWYDDFAEEKIMPLLKERIIENPSELPFFRETRYGSPVNGIAEVPSGSGKYVAIIDNSEQKEETFPGQYPASFIIAHDYNPENGEWRTGAFGFATYEEAREYYKANYGVDLGENTFLTPAEEHREDTGTVPREALRRSVQEEFDNFKAAEMKKTSEEVFGNVLKIRFYTEVSNFFSYEANVGALPDAAVTALYSESPSNLSLLYDYYLKQEYAGVENSEQVRELIDGYVEKYFHERTPEVAAAERVEETDIFDFFGTDDDGTAYYRFDNFEREHLSEIKPNRASIVAARGTNIPQRTLEEHKISFLQIGKDIQEDAFLYPANLLFTSRFIADRDTRNNMQGAVLLKDPLFGLVYNWKGLKEENYVYTAAQLGAVDPDFDPALDKQDGAFSANKTYIVYKLNGATVEETAANVKAFMAGSKNFAAEQAPLIPGWYWETVNYNLFTGEVNPTAEKLIVHFGLTDENLRMQEEEMSTIERLQERARGFVAATGKPHVVIEWSESGEVPNETIMSFDEADRVLRALNAAHSEDGYYKTKLHIYYINEGGAIGAYEDLRYDIGTERAGLVEHIEDYANDPEAVAAGFTTNAEQQGRQRVANILREHLQSVTTEETLEQAVETWRAGNDTLLHEGKEPIAFPDYVAIPYRQFSAATGYSCSEDEMSVWSREHQNGSAAQKAWIVDYLEDINFHTEAGLLADGKYDELQEVIEQRHTEYRLDSIYGNNETSLKEIETRIDLASKYTLEQLQSEIDWRAEHDAGRNPQNEDHELRRELSNVHTKDLYEAVKDYDVYSHSFAPQMLRVYKNFSGAPLPEEEEQPAPATTAAEEPKRSREQKQKQNIKSLLGGKYNAEELQRFLSKELEENALKNERSQQEFIAFLASFRSRQYSVRNQLMLYIQAAQNDYLPVFGTFEEWKGKGTSIQPGSHGLTICRPIFTDVYYTVDVGADGEWEERRYRKFGLSEEKLKELEKRVKEGTARKETELTSFIYTDSVFSMSQTTMTEAQRVEYLQRYNALNTSTENEALYEKLKTIAAELGRPVVEKPIKGEELGWVERADNGTIVIKEDMPVDAKVSVLLHEIGHKLLHIQNATAENRAQKEVQAQLFSHLAMLKLGIDAEKQFSLSYINNWLKASEKDPPVFDADGRELSRGEVLQLNLAAVIPALDALLKTAGENDQSIDAEALKALKDYKADQKPQADLRKPQQKEEKVEIEPLRVVKSTDKAVMVKIPGANPEDARKGVWLPRSCVSTNKDGFVYEATPSLIKEKGLTAKGTLSPMKGIKFQRSLKI